MHVQEIKKIYDISSGCTQPVQVILDNGKEAVLKYPHNPQGIVVLFNEYFSYMLAQKIQLTTPPFGIAEVDASTRLASAVKQYPLPMFEGIGFFTEYLPLTAKVSFRVAKHISNLDETCKMLLLDEIVKNGDRSSSNVLIDFRENDQRMYAIDYSHAFGDPEWNIDTLRIGDYDSPDVWRENHNFYEILVQANADLSFSRLQSEANLISECINRDVVHTIITTTPASWIAAIGESKILHAGEYVLSRVNGITQICAMIIRERGI